MRNQLAYGMLLLLGAGSTSCVDATVAGCSVDADCPEAERCVAGDCQAEVPCTAPECLPGVCGVVTATCGLSADCGLECPDGQTCGSERPNVCAPTCAPLSCEELDADCGVLEDDGCGNPKDCAECAVGVCGTLDAEPNQCPCVAPTYRFSELLVDPADPGRHVGTGQPLVSVEGSVTWLYLSSELPYPNPDRLPGMAGTALARVPMLSPTDLDVAGLEVIPGTDQGYGWVSHPSLGNDGKELFFASTHPDVRDDDTEIHLLHRGAVGLPWEPPVVVEALGLPDGTDPVFSPLLLPGHRWLLYCDRAGPRLAQRGSAVPGDGSFVQEPSPPFSDPFDGDHQSVRLHGFKLSCDSSAMIYVRETFFPAYSRSDLRQIELIPGDPPTFGVPGPYPHLPTPPLGLILGFAEHPDCSTVYFSAASEPYYGPRGCPR